jgi:hypothetical protein
MDKKELNYASYTKRVILCYLGSDAPTNKSMHTIKFLNNYIINNCDVIRVVDNVFEILKKMFLFNMCIQKVAKLEFLIDV